MNARVLAPVFLLGGALLSGCVAVAGAGVGYVISQQVLPNDIRLAQVSLSVDRTWSSVRETMEILVDPKAELEVTEDPFRKIVTKVNGAKVTVEVEAHDLERTVIRVQAEKYLASDNDTSRLVMDKILKRLNEDA